MSDSAAQNSIAGRLKRRLDRAAHKARFQASLKHLHGPARGQAGPQDTTVVALVRDGAYYLDAFFAHYRSIGVRHFVFADNGSTDGTLDRIRQEPGTVILQSKLPWGEIENDFRGYAAKRYCRGRWCLFADMDEIFEFEGQDRIGLPGLTAYLEETGATAMMAQMLEMFPKAPLAEVADMPYAKALEAFCHYDISALERLPYLAEDTGLSFCLQRNQLLPGAGAAEILFGGVRGKVFGERCCLTKHPLVFVGRDVEPGLHPHASAGVRVADVSGLIKHYKFANDSLSRDQRSLDEGSIGHGEDRLRAAAMAGQPGLTLWSADARPYSGLEPLQEAGFLMRSDRFSALAAGDLA